MKPGPADPAGDPAAEPAPVADPAADPAAEPAEDPSAPNFRQRVAERARREAALGASVGERAAAELGHAAEAMALETVRTDLAGERALVGHVIGMHLCLPAGHFHGPRETPALLYLFADALAVRPTDDAPMSTIPIFGLHMVLPPLAVARWLYKAGRIEHANLDLVKDAARFADTIAQWNVDDFAEADEKLEVHRLSDMSGPVHVYEHLGFANVLVLLPNGGLVRLKSALPSSSEAYVKLWELFSHVTWPHGLSTAVPVEAPEAAASRAPAAASRAPDPEHDPASAGPTDRSHSGPQEEPGGSQAAGPKEEED